MLFKKTLKPYMLNAFYTWATDLGYTPLIQIHPHPDNIIPDFLLSNKGLLLNIHHEATRNLVFGKDKIEFQARFNSKSYDITIYHDSIIKIFNKEDKYGIDFDLVIPDDIAKNTKPKLKLVKNED